MIKITNGTVVCEVTNGAYDKIYKAQGYRPIVEKACAPVVHADQVDAGVDPYAELIEKPLSQWNKTEVKTFAEAKGIDLAGTKNVNEAKDRIKVYLDENK